MPYAEGLRLYGVPMPIPTMCKFTAVTSNKHPMSSSCMNKQCYLLGREPRAVLLTHPNTKQSEPPDIMTDNRASLILAYQGRRWHRRCRLCSKLHCWVVAVITILKAPSPPSSGLFDRSAANNLEVGPRSSFVLAFSRGLHSIQHHISAFTLT